VKNGNIYTLNSSGNEIGRFGMHSSDNFLGYSSEIVVVRKGNFIYSYNYKGIELGRFTSYGKFKGVQGKNILIEENSYIYTRDFKGTELSRKSK